MTTLVSMVVLAQANPAALFDASAAAHAATKSIDVTLTTTLKSVTGGGNLKARVAFVRPNSILLRIWEPARPGVAASDRSYFLQGGQLRALDYGAEEWLGRSASTRGGMLDRAESVLGDLNESIGIILSPARMREFYSNFKKMTGWRRSTVGNVSTLRTTFGSGNFAEFKFDRRTNYIRGLRVVNAGRDSQWTFTYATAPKSLSLPVPRGYDKVSAFTEMPTPPSYQSSAVKKLVETSRKAHARLRKGSYQVSENNGDTVEVWFDNGRIRERRRNFDWAYSGGTLTINDRQRGVSYRGRTGRLGALTYLQRVGTTPDPMVRAMLAGRNPIDAIVGPNMVVRSSGSMAIGGATVNLIEVKGTGLTVSVGLRQSNGLIVSTISDVYEGNTRISRLERQLKWTSVGMPLPGNSFTLSVKSPRALPKK